MSEGAASDQGERKTVSHLQNKKFSNIGSSEKEGIKTPYSPASDKKNVVSKLHIAQII